MATTVGLEKNVVDELRSVMRGPAIAPEDPDYDAARTLHNAMIDKRPAVIARCTGVADVQAALDFGLRHDLEIAVKGGGHNVGGKALCDGGIVIDLSGMKGIRVDPASRSVHAQAGVTWGEFDRETQVFGLATTGGAISTTGIAGLTLGGGIGWLQRKHGLACDNLISADVVTPDGRFLRASETENGDLFWGLRGGGGNFGIVTSFEYRLHPLGPQVLGGPMLYPLDAAREVYEFHREFSASAPDELFSEFGLGPLPDGQPGSFLFFVYAGPPDEGERVLEPARKFREPLENFLGPADYCDVQQMFDADLPPGLHNYWKSSDLAELSDGGIETMLNFYAEAPPVSFVIIDQFGGAVARVPDDATAFGHRHSAYDLIIATLWPGPERTEEHVNWARSLWDAMQPYAEESVYVNYLGEEGEERVHAAYGEEKYARLAALKRKYDPDNVLRSNQNIKPAAA